MRFSPSRARMICSWSFAASKRLENFSTATTARTCWPATSARPILFVSRRRRTSANIPAHLTQDAINCRKKRHWLRQSMSDRNLLAGHKRATNIIRIEEKKDKREYTGAPDARRYQLPEEKALAEAIDVAKKEASAAVRREDFAAAMRAVARLRPRVDAFFDKVTVNVDDKALRENRLKLLNEIREATRAVADFSRIEG